MDIGYVAGHRLRADLVAQTVAMIAAAARDGVTLRITQAWRSYEEQVAIFRARYSQRTTGAGPYGDVRWWNGVRYVRTSGAAAAVPGTSNHGLGQAIDFATDSPGAIAWLTKNGAKYGWSRPAWTFRAPTIEPWHWEAVPVLASNPIGGGGGSIPTVPGLPPLTPIEEIDMPLSQTDLDLIEQRIFNTLLTNVIRGPEMQDNFAAAVWAHVLKQGVDEGPAPMPGGLGPTTAETYVVQTRQREERILEASQSGQPTVSLSEADLARIVAAVVAALGNEGPGPSVDETADAVTDELARRLMS